MDDIEEEERRKKEKEEGHRDWYNRSLQIFSGDRMNMRWLGHAARTRIS
jgi:hypothetical protein